jgi:hypothetical protein
MFGHMQASRAPVLTVLGGKVLEFFEKLTEITLFKGSLRKKKFFLFDFSRSR